MGENDILFLMLLLYNQIDIKMECVRCVFLFAMTIY